MNPRDETVGEKVERLIRLRDRLNDRRDRDALADAINALSATTSRPAK